jgi:hypothetical protein|tara:strand:+ start:569 stop:853 length:285 start_codon:yes stop_codon:yes gene_type:complete
MSYYLTSEHANFICDCGYEKKCGSVRTAEAVKRIHEKVCSNRQIKIRLTGKPIGFGSANLHSVHTFTTKKYDLGYTSRKELGATMDYEKEQLKK